MAIARQLVVIGVSVALTLAISSGLYGQEQPAPNSQQESGPAPQSAEQIQALVAPIALYPDGLVAQVLSGATFPDQIALAQGWLQQHQDLSGEKLMKEVDKQSWDPSVKALTQFPSVLDSMAKNLAWTSELGEVYHNQPKDVMDAVQVLRAKAKAAGNLKSSSQITVVQQTPSTIIIQPANPQVVYVPQYNPAVIYGTPYVVPSYTASDVAAASVLSFGVGIAVGAAIHGGCCSWGWSSWNCGWHGGTVVYAGHPYYGSAAWHGAYGAYGYHGYGGYNAAAYHGYGAGGAYHTGAAYSTPYGGAASHTTYGPDGAVHTGSSGYNAATGQAYHSGATTTPNGSSAYHSTTTGPNGAHTSGGGYNAATGQGSHYGASSTAAGGTAYHGSTSTGQHYAGGTTAGGEHWGGSSGAWGHDYGGSTSAASDRGWGSMHSSGFSGFHGGGFRR